jgi:hypothetical protein
MLDLVGAAYHHDFLADLIRIDMVNHTLRIEVCKLNGESLERMALWHMVLYARLELIIRKSLAAYIR